MRDGLYIGAALLLGALACQGQPEPARDGGGGVMGLFDPAQARPSPTVTKRPPAPPSERLDEVLGVCDPGQKPATDRRLWRLNPAQYRNSLAQLIDGRPREAGAVLPAAAMLAGLQVPFAGEARTTRFSTRADKAELSSLEFEQALQAASEAAALVITSWQAQPGSCLPEASGVRLGECVRTWLKERGPILYRRPLSVEEIDRHAALAENAEATLGRNDAAALAIEAMLVSPQFLFRLELGSIGRPHDNDGVIRMGSFELAAALAMTLTDAPPDAELWQQASADRLRAVDDVRAQVKRLIGADPGARAALVRFFREYFFYERAPAVFKDPQRHPFHDAAALVDGTDLWVRDRLNQDGDRDFLTTLLSHPGGYPLASTGENWNLAAPAAPGPMNFPADQRSGILTQPSFLTAFSQGEHSDPVRRGRFISESLLCRPVPDLPIDVVPALPDLGPNATARDRLAVHSRDPGCTACHQLMDPLGLAFESYDDVGRFRSHDNGSLIDGRGELTDAGTADGPFANAVELTWRLAGSEITRACFVRHTVEYFLGRPTAARDACVLHDLDATFAREGGDFLALLAAVFTSPAFLDRDVPYSRW